MTLAQLQELELKHEAVTKRGFESLKRLKIEMKNENAEAEAAWLLEAENLVESFRQVRPLFPSTRVNLQVFQKMILVNSFSNRLSSEVCRHGDALREERLRTLRMTKIEWHLACNWNLVCVFSISRTNLNIF